MAAAATTSTTPPAPPPTTLSRSRSHEATEAFQAEDNALVLRAQQGDRAAFGKLFERHHGRVYGMCTRLLANRAEVEDAVQHVFLEAWRCLHRFEGRSRFSTWITRIAIHTCLGFRRRLKRLFFSEDVEPRAGHDDAQWAAPPMAPDDTAAHVARRRAVQEILGRIGTKKRVVFVLADLEGMTAPEISKILDIPDATVRTRLFHARREFAAHVKSHPGFADLFEKGGILRDTAPADPATRTNENSPAFQPARHDDSVRAEREQA